MRLIKFLAVGLSLLLAGCATVIQLQVKRAPELNLGEVKTLKIEPFDITGHLSLDLGEQHRGGSVKGALVGMAVDAGVNRMAEDRYPELQQAELANLQEIVAKDGFYKINEGKNYDALVTGLLHFTVTDSSEGKSSLDKKGKNTFSYEFKRKAQVNVKFTVLNHAGTVLGASEVTGYAQRVINNESRERARDAAPAWDELVREALAHTAPPFIRKIAPYFTLESRILEKGESDGIKAGNKAAGIGDWATAMQYWKAGEAGNNPRDRIAGLYNLGIYDEVEDRLPDALNKFEQVRNLSGEGRYNADMMRIRSRIEEEKKLQSME